MHTVTANIPCPPCTSRRGRASSRFPTRSAIRSDPNGNNTFHHCPSQLVRRPLGDGPTLGCGERTVPRRQSGVDRLGQPWRNTGTNGKIGSRRPAACADQSKETCREGGTRCVPFQDKDHGMTTDRLTMIFLCAHLLMPLQRRVGRPTFRVPSAVPGPPPAWRRVACSSVPTAGCSWPGPCGPARRTPGR